MNWRLWLAVFVLLMAFWKGDSGYGDLQEQLDDAVHLWTFGDLRVRTREGVPVEPIQYHRYSYGTAILSGPFVLAGRALRFFLGEAVSLRTCAALFVPIAASFGALFAYRLSRELNVSHRTGFFSMLIFTVGGLLLSQSRLFYTEAPFAACVLAAIAWSLEAARAQSAMKACIAGCALGCATTLHATALILTMPMLALAVLFFLRNKLHFRNILFAALPALSGLALVLAFNFMRYGHPLKSGYDYSVTVGESILAPKLLISQAEILARLPIRVFWLMPSYCFLFAHSVRVNQNFMLRGLALILLLQWIFWTSFNGLEMFPKRYFGPSLALAAPGLCLFLAFLERRSERTWAYTILFLLAGGFILTLRGDDGQPPLALTETGSLCGNFWFAPASTPRATDAPLGTAQWAVFTGLLALAAILLRWSYYAVGADGAVESPGSKVLHTRKSSN